MITTLSAKTVKSRLDNNCLSAETVKTRLKDPERVTRGACDSSLNPMGDVGGIPVW